MLSNIAVYCTPTIAQLCLQWLPLGFDTRKKPVLYKKVKTPRKKSFSLPEKVEIPVGQNEAHTPWSFSNWLKTNTCYSAHNQDHIFAMVRLDAF